MLPLRLALVATLVLVAVACGDEVVVPPDMASTDMAHGFDLAGPKSGIGAACQASKDPRGTCAAAQFCVQDGTYGFNGGYCSEDCSSTKCPDDADCFSPGAGFYLCLARCNSDADCRTDNYVCSEYKACIPKDGFYLGSEVRPATNGGMACVQPVATPPNGSPFEQHQRLSLISGGEVSVAADDARGNVVTAWIQLYGTQSIGVATSHDHGMSFSKPIFLPVDNLVDTNDAQSDPVVAVDSQGTFYVTWIGFDGATGNNLITYVARSTDGGDSFPDLFVASPPDEFSTGQFLDKPWMAIGPDDSVYVSWAASASANGAPIMRVTRSIDRGQTWSAPVTATPDETVFHNLGQVAVSADGTVYVATLELQGDAFGDVLNNVTLQRLTADLQLDGQRIVMSSAGDSPSFDPLALVVDGARVYVAYVSGSVHGDWDIRVAASPDRGATVTPSVKVNDDATCATHLHPAASVDGTGKLHVIFYDNRYLDGNLLHAVSSGPVGSGALTFGRNTFVNDESFSFTTERNAANWLGDYPAIAAIGAHLYVAWTDPRTNTTSQIFFTRSGF